MTVCLTELGRAWLALGQEGLAYETAYLGRVEGPRSCRLTELLFLTQGMTLWVTRDEFRRSH